MRAREPHAAVEVQWGQLTRGAEGPVTANGANESTPRNYASHCAMHWDTKIISALKTFRLVNFPPLQQRSTG